MVVLVGLALAVRRLLEVLVLAVQPPWGVVVVAPDVLVVGVEFLLVELAVRLVLVGLGPVVVVDCLGSA